MAYYYNYKFTSPELVYSIIKEELKSYFDTGAIDDLMFPSYVDKCLRKLGNSSYPIREKILNIEDFEARLPDNFYAVREAWLCAEADSSSIQSSNSFYSQAGENATTILIAPITTDKSLISDCTIDINQLVYKTNKQITKSYKKQYLLKPGNISAKRNCDVEYTNEWNFYADSSNYGNGSFVPGDSGYDSFDIRDNKFVTNFRNAVVYLVFYSTDYDILGNQMIPDNYRIREYIETFIKYKMFETLSNQTNDETFNQLQQKMISAKQLADEAYIMAEIEIKKQTVYQKQRSIIRGLKRFNMYELPNRINRNGLRRNS